MTTMTQNTTARLVAPQTGTGSVSRAASPEATTIVRADKVFKTYKADKGGDLQVLTDISLSLHEGEIVAILGRSGAGKSTLLRILAGLIPPTSGSVSYRGTKLSGPNPGVALVFQTFALMPWLTVQKNVELGLEARGMPRAQRERAALAAIDAIGLDGFESAYPKELSGGMRQRVGIARALVLNPDALFMDEPFSSLDVLTAENLRQEVLKLCGADGSDRSDGPDGPGRGDSVHTRVMAEKGVKSMLIVTHNIEEAVQMADRVVVLGSHPGRVIADVPIRLPRPRNKNDEGFQAVVDDLYATLTGKAAEGTLSGTSAAAAVASVSGLGTAATPAATGGPTASSTASAQPQNLNLPNATPGGLAGLVDVVYSQPDGIDLADIASALSFEVDDLFPLVDAATMLGLITVKEGHVSLTDLGRTWHEADILDSKVLFAAMIRDHAPLVHAINQALKQSEKHELQGSIILDLLRANHSEEEARKQFDIAVSWGRYGELFDYDADDDRLTLDSANW